MAGVLGLYVTLYRFVYKIVGGLTNILISPPLPPYDSNFKQKRNTRLSEFYFLAHPNYSVSAWFKFLYVIYQVYNFLDFNLFPCHDCFFKY